MRNLKNTFLCPSTVAVILLALLPCFTACTGQANLDDSMALVMALEERSAGPNKSEPIRFTTADKYSVPGPARFDLYFTKPGTSNTTWIDPVLDDELVQLIGSATTKVDISIFDFDRQNVIDALVEAKARGVVVRMVGDGDNVAEAGYSQLVAAGIPIVNRPAGSAIMHNKFVIVDGLYVWCGSANLSDNDIIRNNNNALILQSAELASLLTSEFNEMFVGGRFGSAKNPVLSANQTVINGVTTEVYTGPAGNLMNEVLSRVDSANLSVHFMIFTFTRADLKDRLLARKNAGVQVSGVMEELQANGAYSQDDALVFGGVPVYIDGNYNSIGQGGGILHHKVLIIDGNSTSDPMIITGSFNWTDAAVSTNDETLFIFHSRELSAAFLEEFCYVSSTARLHTGYAGTHDTGCGGKLAVNEALPNPDGTDTGNEFVEIVNSGIGRVEMTGWTLEVNGTVRHNFPNYYSIPADGVSVIYDSGSHSVPGAVNASTGALSLGNTSGSIALRTASGTTSDSLSYGSAPSGISFNRNPDLQAGATVVRHNQVAGAAGNMSPGRKVDQSTFTGVGEIVGPDLPLPASGELIITQVASRGASASDEYVELYNNTDHSLSIGGIKLQYQASTCSGFSTRYTVPIGTILSPGQFYLVANGSGYIPSAPELIADGTFSSGLADSGHTRLLDANGQVLDLVAYGSTSCQGEGNSSAPSPTSAQSIRRKNYPYTNARPARDTDSNAQDFALSARVPHSGASPAEPSMGLERPIAGQLLITAFATRGPLSAYDEFVEIYNPTRKNLTVDGVAVEYQTASCGGWQSRLLIPPGTVLAPGQFFLAANLRGYVAPASGLIPDGELSTSGFADSAQLRLKNSTGIALDAVAFGSGHTCFAEGQPVAAQQNVGGSIARGPVSYSPGSPAIDTGNNFADFLQMGTRSPRSRSSVSEPSGD